MTLEGAALLCMPQAPTTQLESALREDGLADDALLAIAAAYQAQQWTICTQVREGVGTTHRLNCTPRCGATMHGHTLASPVPFPTWLQVVQEKWKEAHVRRWAKEVLGLSDEDVGRLPGRWFKGSFLAHAREEQVPPLLSESAKATLSQVLNTKMWSQDWGQRFPTPT